MSATPRATIPRVPRSGTSAPTAGEASGIMYDLRKPRPSNATEVIVVWPPLSAPCALHYDQHGDNSTTATTSSRCVSDDHPRMRAANSCRAIRSRRGFTLSRALRTMASTSPPGGVIGRASADGRSASMRLPAWVGCLVKTVYGPDNVLAQLSTTSPARTLQAQVDPDITGTGTGPTTSESTPPALPPVPPGPLRTSVPDGALTVTGAPGCRRYRRTVC